MMWVDTYALEAAAEQLQCADQTVIRRCGTRDIRNGAGASESGESYDRALGYERFVEALVVIKLLCSMLDPAQLSGAAGAGFFHKCVGCGMQGKHIPMSSSASCWISPFPACSPRGQALRESPSARLVLPTLSLVTAA